METLNFDHAQTSLRIPCLDLFEERVVFFKNTTKDPELLRRISEIQSMFIDKLNELFEQRRCFSLLNKRAVSMTREALSRLDELETNKNHQKNFKLKEYDLSSIPHFNEISNPDFADLFDTIIASQDT